MICFPGSARDGFSPFETLLLLGTLRAVMAGTWKERLKQQVFDDKHC